jgi:heterodisulfide reductase subunit B
VKYSYYPGCAQHGTSVDYRKSIERVCSHLNIELNEIKDWNCCGAVHVPDPLMQTALSARTLSLAEHTITTPCNLCFSNLLRAKSSMENAEVRKQVNSVLEEQYTPKKVKHLLEVFVSDLGLEELKKHVTANLEKIKAVSYYGCLLTRPENEFDSPENPTKLDEFIAAVGAKPLPYYYKTKCCGGPILLTHEDTALKLAHDLLLAAKNTGADCIVVTCPMCHMQLDAKQREIEARYNVKINLPVIFFTQLAGLAFGMNAEELGLNMHLVSAEALLKLRG